MCSWVGIGGVGMLLRAQPLKTMGLQLQVRSGVLRGLTFRLLVIVVSIVSTTYL